MSGHFISFVGQVNAVWKNEFIPEFGILLELGCKMRMQVTQRQVVLLGKQSHDAAEFVVQSRIDPTFGSELSAPLVPFIDERRARDQQDLCVSICLNTLHYILETLPKLIRV